MGVEISHFGVALASRDHHGNNLTAGFEPFTRMHITSTTAALGASGRMYLSYFTASEARTFTKLGTVSGGTAAGATPTLIRYGLYSVASDGGGTLVAATDDVDSSSLLVSNTKYTHGLTTSGSLPASYTLSVGQRYATAYLVVTGAALPTAVAFASAPNVVTALAPRICGYLGGQTDLPTTFADASLTITGTAIWVIGE